MSNARVKHLEGVDMVNFYMDGVRSFNEEENSSEYENIQDQIVSIEYNFPAMLMICKLSNGSVIRAYIDKLETQVLSSDNEDCIAYIAYVGDFPFYVLDSIDE